MANNLPRFARIFKGRVRRAISADSWSPLTVKRQYGSALYISGKKANKDYSYLAPYLDFDTRFADLERLQKDLSLRGLDIDATEIKKAWDFYKSVNTKKLSIEKTMGGIKREIGKFYGRKDLTAEEEQEFSKLQTNLDVVKADLTEIKNTLWTLDETIVEKLLKLPNEVDQGTPHEGPVILKRSGILNVLPEEARKSHLEIGTDLGLVEYRNPMQCYLCNDAALFELGVLGFAGKVFSVDNMIRVAGSDFSRSLVVEGSGLNHENPYDAFLINNHSEVEKESPNRMHLVGGSSLISFLAMHTKQLINPNHFPLKYFSTGRQYTPFAAGSTPIGLFTLCQASTAHVFMIVKDAKSEEHSAEFENLLNTVCKLYDGICDHYQVVTRPASDLRPWETMRVSFELWSQFTKQYIEVGHISVCGHYFSKRLLIAYQTPTGRDFPAVISGTVLSVPRLLGCLLEQNPENFVIPPKIAEHMPVDPIA